MFRAFPRGAGSDPPLWATHGGNAGFPEGNLYGVKHGLTISRLLPADLAGMEADLEALDERRLNLDEEPFACRWLVRQLAMATRPERLETLGVRQDVEEIKKRVDWR